MDRQVLLEQERSENYIHNVSIYHETLILIEKRENNFKRQRVEIKWQAFGGFPLVMYNYSVPRKAVKPSRKSKLLLKRRVWKWTNFWNEEGG